MEDAAHLELLEAAVAADAVLVVDDGVPLGDLAEIAQRRRAAGRGAPRGASAAPKISSSATSTSRSAGRRNPRDSEPDRIASGARIAASDRRARPAPRRRRRARSRAPGPRRAASPPADRRGCGWGRTGARAGGRRSRTSGDRAAACRGRPARRDRRGGRRRARAAARRASVALDSEISLTRARAAPSSSAESRSTSTACSSTRRIPSSAARASSSVQHELGGVERQPVLDAPAGGRLAQLGGVAPRFVEHRLRLLDHEGACPPAGSRAAAPCARERPAPATRCRRTASPSSICSSKQPRLRRREDGGVGGRQQLGARIGARRPDRLAHRVQVQLLQRAQRALRAGVVEADRLDLVAEQLDAHRVPVDRREDVDDRAAHGEGAGVLDHRRAREAGGQQHRDRLVAVERRRRRGRRGRARRRAPAGITRRNSADADATRTGGAKPCDRRKSAAMRRRIERRSGCISAYGEASGAGRCSTLGGASGSSPVAGDGRKKPDRRRAPRRCPRRRPDRPAAASRAPPRPRAVRRSPAPASPGRRTARRRARHRGAAPAGARDRRRRVVRAPSGSQGREWS